MRIKKINKLVPGKQSRLGKKVIKILMMINKSVPGEQSRLVKKVTKKLRKELQTKSIQHSTKSKPCSTSLKFGSHNINGLCKNF